MEPIVKMIPRAAALLGASLILGLWVHGSYMAVGRTGNTITVTGSVKQRVTSDLARWTASFGVRGELGDVKRAVDLSAARTERLRQYVRELGMDEKAITALPVQTNAIYDSAKGGYYGPTQDVLGYNVMQEVRVESNDVEKVERLANEVKSLTDQGLVFDYQRTEYYYTKLAELRPQLFAEATKDARERAIAIAGGTGARVGELRSARTGVIQVLAPNSIDIADYGAYDLSTKEKEVSATVSVSFALE